jgi:hypothetical protein
MGSMKLMAVLFSLTSQWRAAPTGLGLMRNKNRFFISPRFGPGQERIVGHSPL